MFEKRKCLSRENRRNSRLWRHAGNSVFLYTKVVEYFPARNVTTSAMKKQWMLMFVAGSVMLSSCADPYYGSGYGAGPYPANSAEALVPLVVGAAVVGALLSDDNDCRPSRPYYRDHHHCPPPHYGW